MEGLKNKDGTVALSNPMLSKSNYTVWAMKMRAVMMAHGIWEAIEPTNTKALVDVKVDIFAVVVIYQAIPEDILLAVAEKTSVKGVWDAVKTMCQGAERVKQARVQTLKMELKTLSMKETESMDDFSMTLSGLITSAMEQFGNINEMTFEEAVGSLKEHEEKLKGHTEKSIGQLLLTEEEWLRREASDCKLLLTRDEWLKKSNKNGGEGSSNLRSRGNFQGVRGVRDRSKVRCLNCSAYGHFAIECQREKETLLISENDVMPKLKSEVKANKESNLWYLDNGASNHMTGYRTKFRELDESITGRVKFGDGSMAENGNKVILNGAFLWVYDAQWRLVMKVKMTVNRLYKIILETSMGNCFMSKLEEMAWRWHSRLGHVNFAAMTLMSNKKMALGLPSLIQPNGVCTGCQMAKQTRKPF
ncbi:uncharacterized protein LOC141664527 [Apium graveolens]|uniref:uncharacterized protein LOC141664527 n=1 Tax=Apium graveolens TaxID=4045 RepID=UPI003D7A85E5